MNQNQKVNSWASIAAKACSEKDIKINRELTENAAKAKTDLKAAEEAAFNKRKADRILAQDLAQQRLQIADDHYCMEMQDKHGPRWMFCVERSEDDSDVADLRRVLQEEEERKAQEKYEKNYDRDLKAYEERMKAQNARHKEARKEAAQEDKKLWLEQKDLETKVADLKKQLQESRVKEGTDYPRYMTEPQMAINLEIGDIMNKIAKIECDHEEIKDFLFQGELDFDIDDDSFEKEMMAIRTDKIERERRFYSWKRMTEEGFYENQLRTAVATFDDKVVTKHGESIRRKMMGAFYSMKK